MGSAKACVEVSTSHVVRDVEVLCQWCGVLISTCVTNSAAFPGGSKWDRYFWLAENRFFRGADASCTQLWYWHYRFEKALSFWFGLFPQRFTAIIRVILLFEVASIGAFSTSIRMCIVRVHDCRSRMIFPCGTRVLPCAHGVVLPLQINSGYTLHILFFVSSRHAQ